VQERRQNRVLERVARFHRPKRLDPVGSLRATQPPAVDSRPR
jgi:hypothetical protein